MVNVRVVERALTDGKSARVSASTGANNAPRASIAAVMRLANSGSSSRAVHSVPVSALAHATGSPVRSTRSSSAHAGRSRSDAKYGPRLVGEVDESKLAPSVVALNRPSPSRCSTASATR
jgi:hypothetical protein